MADRIDEQLALSQPKAVWKQVKRKEVPSTWQVLDQSLNNAIKNACLAAAVGVVLFGIVGVIIGVVSYLSQQPLNSVWVRGVWVAEIGAVFGAVCFIQVLTRRDRLVLMPDGFIWFSGWNGVPSRTISYKEVEDIRFDSRTKKLVVTTSWSGVPKDRRKSSGGAVDIRGFNEAPHLIAQRVERAYASFKARNNQL